MLKFEYLLDNKYKGPKNLLGERKKGHDIQMPGKQVATDFTVTQKARRQWSNASKTPKRTLLSTMTPIYSSMTLLVLVNISWHPCRGSWLVLASGLSECELWEHLHLPWEPQVEADRVQRERPGGAKAYCRLGESKIQTSFVHWDFRVNLSLPSNLLYPD